MSGTSSTRPGSGGDPPGPAGAPRLSSALGLRWRPASGADAAMTQATYEYSLQDASGATCTANAWAKVMPTPSADQRTRLKARAKELLKQHDAVLVAHYYVDGDLQDLALETRGYVAGSPA